MMSKLIVSVFWVLGIAIVLYAPEMEIEIVQKLIIGYIGCFVFLLFAVLLLLINIKDKK